MQRAKGIIVSLLFFLIGSNYASNHLLSIVGGVAPINWHIKEDFLAISCNATTVFSGPTPVIPLFSMPKFNDLFHVPWTIGLYYAADLNNNFGFYINANYRQANQRTYNQANIIIPTIDTIQFAISPQDRYQIFDAYIGVDWSHYICQSRLFLGVQVGIVHHNSIDFTFTTGSIIVPPPTLYTSEVLPLFRSGICPAGGICIGVEMNISCRCSFGLMAWGLATCGPRAEEILSFDFATQSVFINPALAPNAFKVGSIGTEFIFPITAALTYQF